MGGTQGSPALGYTAYSVAEKYYHTRPVPCPERHRPPVLASTGRMEDGESSPLLSQDNAGQEQPLTRNSPPTSSHPGPAPWEDQVGAWSCRCCPGTKHQASSVPLSTGISCVKYLTFLSNFLFSLLALLALLAGLWGLTVKGSLGSDWGGPLPTDPMLVLVIGGLAVSVVSLSGCLGALCENSCLLHCYCGAVLTCLALEALAGALVVAFWDPLQDSLEYTLRVAIIHYQDEPDLHFLLDQVQLGLQCCGAVSYQDWQQNLYFNCSSPGVQACSLPASCCIDPQEEGTLVNTQCGYRVLHLDEDTAAQAVHLQGCGPALQQWLQGNMWAMGSCVIVVVTIQGTELLLASWLLRALAARKTAEDRAWPFVSCPGHPSTQQS